MLGGGSIADWTGLEHVDWVVAPQTIPIILLALVYHDLTPGTRYTDGFNLSTMHDLWQCKTLTEQDARLGKNL